MNMRYFGIVAAIAVCLALAGPAAAVSYTVSGWGPQQFPASTPPAPRSPWGPNGYPGDTVELQTYTGTLDLTPGTSTQKINTLLWTIDYTYGGTATNPGTWSDLLFIFNVDRNMTIDGVGPETLSQTGSLLCTWENDVLGFSGGSTVTFFVQGYRVDVTPLGLDYVGGSNFDGSNPWVQPSRNVMAQFDVTEAPIPEPVTMAGLMMGIGGLVTYIRKRRTA
jgi:hypothetical protein